MSLCEIIIKSSNNKDDLQFIYDDYCYFQDLIWNKKMDETLIFYAIKNSNFTLFDFLIEKDCDVNYKTKNGSTPLRCAIINQVPYFVKKLVEKGATLEEKELKTYLYLNKYPKFDLRNNKQKEIERIFFNMKC